MNPSKKYMPNNRNITDEDDIKLVPFNTGRQPLSNDQLPGNMTPMGWIPVYAFDNPPTNAIGSSMNNGMGPGISIGSDPSTGTGSGPSTELGTELNKNSTNGTLTPETYYPYTPSNPSLAPSSRDLPNIIQLLSDFDLDLDEDVDLVRNCSDKSIDKIYDKIEKKHPEICALVKAYNIPHPIFKLLIRRVIKISLNYCKRDDE
ncbi:hypothetical protein [Clostridium vincentii]|uniref:Uncharacterized protein n=1 Tax=Clostridium vincentii TaxID=52704 RepID=A0A2T0BG44_9CLOT|nr:hypothetical protein [Clostridium vincentii]PRR82792.1 hypothetical protein CLVI_14290 [Clostridium vincentii]